MRMVGPGGVARYSNFNGLKLQTRVSARIERKGLFGAVTNWKTDIPPARNTAGRHIAPSEGAKSDAAPCTNAGTPAAQGFVRKIGRYTSRGRPSQLGFVSGACSGAHALFETRGSQVQILSLRSDFFSLIQFLMILSGGVRQRHCDNYQERKSEYTRRFGRTTEFGTALSGAS
jgi:hypothetical protein